MDAHVVSDTLPHKKNNYLWLIVFAVTMFIILIVAIFLIISNGNKLNNNTNSETNTILSTCPDSLSTQDGKPVGILNGKTIQMSKESYDWVQENCLYDSNNKNISKEDSLKGIVLTNLGIDIGKYDVMTGRAGAIIFDKEALKINSPYKKVFIEFGETVTKPDGDMITKTFPEIVYSQLDADTNITSMSDGTIFEIEEQQETKDFAVTVMYNNFWTVNYDHIINLSVNKGEKVKAGQILGKVSINKDGITGYTEVQVKYSANGGQGASTSYCPVSLLSPDVKAVYMDKLNTLMADWEEYYGDNTIYNETIQLTPGCVQEMYTE